MKNREKHTNTDDAVKAYEAHKKEHNCDCTFEKWLDMDEDEARNEARSLFDGVMVLALVASALAALSRAGTTENEGKPEGKKPGDDDGIENIECPFCHQKNGRIMSRGLFPDFYCPQCDLIIAKKSIFERPPFTVDISTFKSWFDKLTVPAPKKD